MRWRKVTIGDIGKVITGKTPPKVEPKFFDGQVQFVSPIDLDWDGYYLRGSTNTMVTEEALERFKNQVLPPNSVLFTCIGYTFGKVGIATEYCLSNQQINSVIVKEGYDYQFVYYLLIHHKDFIKTFNSGLDTPIVKKSSFEKVELEVPPLPTQHRIASILSAYDDLIENNLKRIKLLEEAAQHIYREWFVHFRFPGHERVRRVADGLPEGWRRVALEDLSLMVKRGVSPEYVTDGGFTVINQKCIRDNQIDLAHAKYSSIDKKPPDERFVRVFDVLVNSTGTGTLGRMAIVKAEMEDTFVDTHVTIVRPNPDQVAPLYLGYQLMQQKPVIENMGRGATNQIELSRSELSGLPTTVPPNELQWMFHNSIHPIIKQAAILTAQSVYAKEARDILLPRLMNRTIEV